MTAPLLDKLSLTGLLIKQIIRRAAWPINWLQHMLENRNLPNICGFYENVTNWYFGPKKLFLEWDAKAIAFFQIYVSVAGFEEPWTSVNMKFRHWHELLQEIVNVPWGHTISQFPPKYVLAQILNLPITFPVFVNVMPY